MSNFALDVAAQYIHSGKLTIKKARKILAQHGIELRVNPTCLSFHNKAGRNLHQITSFNRAEVRP